MAEEPTPIECGEGEELVDGECQAIPTEEEITLEEEPEEKGGDGEEEAGADEEGGNQQFLYYYYNKKSRLNFGFYYWNIPFVVFSSRKIIISSPKQRKYSIQSDGLPSYTL
jgi:hypothetical protein